MPPLLLLHQWWLELYNGTTLFNLAVFSAIILFSVLYLLKIAKSDILSRKPPSPTKLPIIGNLHQIGKVLHQRLHALSIKYGPLMLLHLGSSPLLVVSSSEIAEEITKTHDVVFANRPNSRAVNVLFYDGLDMAFAPYGELWRNLRKLCVVELLSQRRVQAFHFVRAQEVAKVLENISLSCLNGTVIDMAEMFVTITNNIISRSALGRIYETEQGIENFGKLSRKAVHLVGAFCFEDLFPCLRWMDALTGFRASLNRTYKLLDDFFDKVIEDHQALKCSDDIHEEKLDLVDILLNLQQDVKSGINLTKENIKGILMDIVLAGTETTATSMEWAMAELVKNPSVMIKVQEEVRKVVGVKSQVDETDINKMKYFKCVIKETLRLHPPVLAPRETRTSVMLRGYQIPAKTRVLINIWAIQRDPLLWDNPEKFFPERFFEKNFDYGCTQSHFNPFGYGRKICPGISYGIVAFEYVLANLLYWFDWRLPDDTTVENLDMSDSYQFSIQKKLPLLLVPLPRST